MRDAGGLDDIKSAANEAEGSLNDVAGAAGDLASSLIDMGTDGAGAFAGLVENAGGLKSALSGMGGKGIALGIGAGAVAAGIAGVSAANDLNKALNSLQAQTGLTESEMAGYEDVLRDIYTNNYGESFDDIANAMSTVRQQMGDLSDADLQTITESAFVLRDTFGYDIQESVRAASAMVTQFGIDGDTAMSMIAAGAQNGLDFSGELLDSISEYSVQFAKVGLDADDMFKIMQKGAETGAFNLDKIGDAVKEFSIRVVDGSATTKQGFEAIGLDADEMAAKFAAGGDTAKEAFDETIQALANMEDPLAQNQAGVALFGTMWEDLGPEVVSQLASIEDGAYDAAGAMDGIKEVKYDDITNQLESVGRKFQDDLLVPIGQALIPVLQTFMSVLTPIVELLGTVLTPIIEATGELMQDLMEPVGELLGLVGDLLEPIGELISGALTPLFEIFQSLLEPLTSIVSAILPVFMSLFEGIVPVLGTVLQAIQPIIDILGSLISTILDVLTPVINGLASLLTGTLQSAFNIIIGVIDTVTGVFDGIITFIKGVFSGDWKKAWEGISSIFSGIWNGLEGIVKGAVNLVIGVINGFTDSNLNHTGIYLYSKGKIMIHLTFDYKTDEKCTTPGQYLKYHRTFQGFTTRELAEKVGIVPATLVLYENDRHPIKHSTAVALANALGIDRNRLLDKYTAFVDYPYSSLLKKVRQELSLTQMQMAEVIGIGQTSYSGWEREIRVPRRKEYEKILAALKKLKVNVDTYLCHPAST